MEIESMLRYINNLSESFCLIVHAAIVGADDKWSNNIYCLTYCYWHNASINVLIAIFVHMPLFIYA